MLTQRRLQVAPNGTNRQPRSASPLPAAPSVHPTALRRTRRRRRTPQAATWPQQAAPPPHAAAGARPRSRCSDSSCAPPRLALYPLPALAPRCTHTNRPCKQASGVNNHRCPLQGVAPQRHHRHPQQSFRPSSVLRSNYMPLAVICTQELYRKSLLLTPSV